MDFIVVCNSLFTNGKFRLEKHITQPIMLLKFGLFLTLCLFTLQASQIKGKNLAETDIGGS